jgi:signal peptidase II
MQNFNSFKLWSRGFIVFLILLGIDIFSKRWAISLNNDISFLGIRLGLSNFGGIFGFLNRDKLILRVIHYTTFLGPLLLLYFFFSFQFLTMDKSRKLNIYLSVWMAGIVGNILDRILYGPVISFIHMGPNIVFNLSHIMMVVGSIGFFAHMYRYRKDYIFSNQRKFRLLQAGLQYDYVGKILFVCLFLCITISIFSFTFMKFYLSEYNVVFQHEVLKTYLIQMLIISGLYLMIIVMMGFHFSSRFVGPLYGFEKFVEKLENGDMEATFRVRENDHHKNLEAIADTIKKHWKP